MEPGGTFWEDEDDNEESGEGHQGTDDGGSAPLREGHADERHYQTGHSLFHWALEKRKRRTYPVEEGPESHPLLWEEHLHDKSADDHEGATDREAEEETDG